MTVRSRGLLLTRLFAPLVSQPLGGNLRALEIPGTARARVFDNLAWRQLGTFCAPYVERVEKIDLKKYSADFAEGEAVVLGTVIVNVGFRGVRTLHWSEERPTRDGEILLWWCRV